MSESPTWVKSSYSSTGNCVEVAGQPGWVLIRDAKDQSGPVLSISAEAWRRFTGQVKCSLAVDLRSATPAGSSHPSERMLSRRLKGLPGRRLILQRHLADSVRDH
jgi:hypothetical protein